MKYLFLLFAIPLMGQQVVPDTTSLKSNESTGVVILEQFGGATWDKTGGGLFHMIDSTYAEGTHAFNHPYAGKQWARLGAFGTLTATSFTLSAGHLDLPSTVVGENVFTTTATADTVVIPGALATDTYFISGEYTAGVDQQDVLQWTAKADTLIVTRMASGESALKYSWLRIR